MKEFSKSKMKEVLKTQTDKRASEGAAKSLDQKLYDHGTKIAEKAIEIAEEKGRITVKAEDIREALKR